MAVRLLDGVLNINLNVHQTVRVGRSNDVDLAFVSGSVSRHHFDIITGNSLAALIDRESSNGTYVNGERCQANLPCRLFDGAVVAFGEESFTIHFEDPAVGTSLPPIPTRQMFAVEIPEEVTDKSSREQLRPEASPSQHATVVYGRATTRAQGAGAEESISSSEGSRMVRKPVPKSQLIRLLYMSDLEMNPAELDQPVSVNSDNSIASLRDVIAEYGHEVVRERFEIEERDSNRTRRVSQLNDYALRTLAIAVLELESDVGAKLVGAEGAFSPQDLVREVRRGSSVGKQFVDSIRQHAQFLENAAVEGRLKPMAVSRLEPPRKRPR